jgi:hypothetical protein
VFHDKKAKKEKNYDLILIGQTGKNLLLGDSESSPL